MSLSLALSVLVGLAILSGVGAYLVVGLPRLSFWPGLAASVALVLALLCAASLLSPTAPLMGVAAVIAGHVGWMLGRQSRRRRRTSERRERPGPGRRRGSSGRRAGTSSGGTPRDTERPAAALPVQADAPPKVSVPAAASTGPVSVPAAPTAPPKPPFSPLSTQPTGGLPLADLQRTSLGRYRIDRAIGRGSMGAVFLGVDPMLGRQVAIKTMALGQEFAGAELEEAKQRFFREAETAGRLQHRDIVTIYDVGEEQDLAYIAMEFLKGHDLQRHTHPGSLLPVPVVVRTAARVADALAYAHSQGVVHRDVKPANVMLHQPTGAVKVTDFGIARVTDASRTRTGMVLGTPSFMSPEHLAGQRVDGRTDLYALGVMLYQLLAGELPFHADSMAKLMYRIANEPAPDLKALRPELPQTLVDLVNRALQKSPAARHPDGALMAAELRAIDAAGSGPLWTGAGRVPEAEPAAAPGSAFASTVRLAPGQNGHNSTL
jgi:serine/threonine-protein kinase